MKRFSLSAAFALILLILFTACSTSSVSTNVMVPADIDVPHNIQTIGLVNRYKPAKGDKFWNVMEGLLTGEGIGTDKRGAETSLQGLANALYGSPRFTMKKLPVELEGSGVATFPEPLAWEEVEKICNEFGVHGLVTIESFDSDSRVTVNPVERTRKLKDGTKQTYIVHVADLRLQVWVGWRFYDPVKRTIIDQYRMVEEMHWDAEGPTPAAATGNLPGKERIIQDLGAITGDKYAARISPTWVAVSRMYYIGKDQGLKSGKYRVQAGDWSGAQEVWLPLTESADPKTAGRACYNMALAMEMEGDLQTAMEWCKKAAYDYNNKKAISYLNVLKQRQADVDRLDQQLN